MQKSTLTLILVFQLHKKKNMRLKVAFAILVQVFILPTFARDRPPRHWSHQDIINNTPNSKFGTYVALGDLINYFDDDNFDTAFKCYNNIKEKYNKAIKEFTEKMKGNYFQVEKLFKERYTTIFTGAEPYFNYIISAMSEYPNKIDDFINKKELNDLQSYTGNTIFAMNQHDFQLDVSMQKLTQQDETAQKFDNDIVEIKKVAQEVSKSLTGEFEDCYYSTLSEIA